MPEPIETPTSTTPTEDKGAPVETPIVEDVNLLDGAVKAEQEAKASADKALLEKPDDQLSPEEKVQKADLVKANEAAEKLAKDNAVPEDGKYKFIVPEGLEVDPDYSAKASEVMKKHGITQAAATELGELAAGQIKKIGEAYTKQQEANFKTYVDGLKSETLKSLGADAQKELSFAAKSRDRLFSPEFVKKMNDSGMANDVDFIKDCISLGKKISEGDIVGGKGGAELKRDPLRTLYDKTN